MFSASPAAASAPHLTGSAVDFRRHLAREGSYPHGAGIFREGSVSSMELEAGPVDAPKVAHALGHVCVLPRKVASMRRKFSLIPWLSINACL